MYLSAALCNFFLLCLNIFCSDQQKQGMLNWFVLLLCYLLVFIERKKESNCTNYNTVHQNK